MTLHQLLHPTLPPLKDLHRPYRPLRLLLQP